MWRQSRDMAVQEPLLRSEASSSQTPAGVLLPQTRGQTAIRTPQPVSTSPTQPPRFTHSFLSPCTNIPPHKPTRRQQRDHPPLRVPPRNGCGIPLSPTAAAPHPSMGPTKHSGDRGWEERPTQTVVRAFSPRPWLPVVAFPFPLPLSLAKRISQRLLSVLPCRGGSSRLHPSPVLGAEEGMPHAKNCCRGQGRTKATAKRVGASQLCAPS